MTRSSPSMRLVRVDLPTLGRPTIANLMGRSANGVSLGVFPGVELTGSHHAQQGLFVELLQLLFLLCLGGRADQGLEVGARASSSRLSTPRPWAAAICRPRPGPDRRTRTPRESPSMPSVLLATRNTFLWVLRRCSAMASIRRGETGTGIHHEEHHIGLFDGQQGTARPSSARSSSVPSIPPVSTTINSSSPSFAWPYLRSRVRPGSRQPGHPGYGSGG